MTSKFSVLSNSSSSAHGGAKNETLVDAAAALKQAKAARMALQQLYNQRVPGYYASSMAGLILLFTIFHWSRFLYARYATNSLKEASIMKLQVKIARKIRHTLIQPIFGFTSVGHAFMVLLYWTINISLTVTNVDWSSHIGIAKRCGWMAIINIAFITFLALKNTPLAFLTAYSYERLNPLHQIGGYTTITYVFLHVTLISESFKKLNFTGILVELPQINAMIAASAILVILVTAIFVRKLRYEVFYTTHVTMYMLVLINIGLHRPELALKSLIITIFAALLWSSDRIIRLSRISWYSYGNRATITPLPRGGTRIVLCRSSSRAISGTHCFLWIPKIRSVETHPFTIVNAKADFLELVIAAYDGFTRDLHDYAMKYPGISLRASIDGPYGVIPNFAKTADKVVMIAGGSGASFTFGVALDMIKRLGTSTKTTIDFIWTVKDQESLSWFSKELSELQSSPLVTTSLHTTRSPYPSTLNTSSSPSSLLSPVSFDPEKHQTVSLSPITETSSKTALSQLDIEKQPALPANPWNSSSSLDIISGRPDIESIINSIVDRANEADRIAIVACGPDSLMKIVRRTAAVCVTVGGPSVELHCEQFGW